MTSILDYGRVTRLEVALATDAIGARLQCNRSVLLVLEPRRNAEDVQVPEIEALGDVACACRVMN
jgi:hypothetical protein